MSDQYSPTPERIFQAINAFQSSAALKGALELGLFTALGSESKTALSLSKKIGAAEKGVRILCDFLVIGGLLQKECMEYRSSQDAALFLDETSPAYLGSASRFMLGTDVFDSFSDLARRSAQGRHVARGTGYGRTGQPAVGGLCA